MSHVVMLDGNRVGCMHCGRSYVTTTPENPQPICVVTAGVRAFGEEHADCESQGVRCSACLRLGHDIADHVRLHVDSAERWSVCGDTGISSMSIWLHMMGRPQDYSWGARPPVDPGDFGRCYRLLEAPWADGWRARMREMAVYPAWMHVAHAWAELETLWHEESGGETAPRLYARMRELTR